MTPRTPKGTLRRAPKGKLVSVQRLALEELRRKVEAIPLIEGPVGPAGRDGQSAELGPEDILAIAEMLKKDSLFKEQLRGEKGDPGQAAPKALGGGGAPRQFKYVPIRTATYTLKAKDTVQGITVLGVDYDGDVTITLPDNLTSDRMIIVNDESGSAGSNNITVQTN